MAYKKLIKVSNVCQLLYKSKYPSVITAAGVTTTSNGDGSITINGTATKSHYINCTPIYSQENNGHVFYICANNTTMSYSTWYYGLLNQQNCYDYGGGGISKTDASRPRRTGIVFNKGIVFDNVIIKPQIFDLTEMYGAGHEPTTVEQFRQDFPEEMYDYRPYCWLTSYKRVFVTGGGNYLTSYKTSLVCKTKNLFDINSVSNLNNWVTKISVDHPYGYYTFYLNPNTTYTFSRKYASNNDRVYACFSKNYGVADDFFIHPTVPSFVKDKLSFTTDNTGIMYLNVYAIRSVMNSFIELIEEAQLELGDTATDYVPYGHL